MPQHQSLQAGDRVPGILYEVHLVGTACSVLRLWFPRAVGNCRACATRRGVACLPRV